MKRACVRTNKERRSQGWVAYRRVTPAALLALLTGCGEPSDDDATSPTPEASSPTPTPLPEITPTPGPVDWVAHVEDLMAFWQAHNLDPTYGGYYTGVDRTGHITNRDKVTRCVSREVYGFTKAFQLTGDETYLEHARSGVDFLLTHALDTESQGFYAWLDETGENVEQDSRSLFDLSYALNGLSAYFEVTHDPTVRDVLIDHVSLIWQLAWDPERGGLFRELTQDMSAVKDDDKDFNANVDPATAFLLTFYASVASYGDDSSLSATLQEYLRLMGMAIVDHLLDPDGTGWIGENFNSDWTYDPDGGDFGDRTLCGHNLKTVWLLTELSFITNSSLFLSEAETLVERALPICRDLERGGIYDMIDRQTDALVYGEQKAWWQQEEGIVASRLMQAATGKSYYGRVADDTTRFYLEHFLDRDYGEVYFSVEGDGTPQDTTKGNEWKSAYHSVENAFVNHLYDAFLVRGEAVVLYYHFEPDSSDRRVRLSPLPMPYQTYSADDPALLEGTSIALETPSQLVIPAGASGTLAVTYRP